MVRLTQRIFQSQLCMDLQMLLANRLDGVSQETLSQYQVWRNPLQLSLYNSSF